MEYGSIPQFTRHLSDEGKDSLARVVRRVISETAPRTGATLQNIMVAVRGQWAVDQWTEYVDTGGLREIADVGRFMGLAKEFDAAMNYERAINIGKRAMAVCQELPNSSTTFDTASALATFYDHAGRYEDGLNLLNRVLAIGEIPLNRNSYEWAIYQRAILLRRCAEELMHRNPAYHRAAEDLRCSFEDFERILNSENEQIVAAANHQLGVIKLINGKIDEAIVTFQLALEQRVANLGRCYDHRRIGQCFSRLGNTDDALHHFTKATTLLPVGNDRLRLEIERDCKAYAIVRQMDIA